MTAGVLHACADAWGLQYNNAIYAAGHALWLNIGAGSPHCCPLLGLFIARNTAASRRWQAAVGCSSSDGSVSAPRTRTY